MKQSGVVVLMLLMLAGCESRTKYGECIGAFAEKDPSLEYEMSVQNAIVAVMFSETIVVPAVMVLDQYRCPVAVKKPAVHQ